MAEVKHLLHVHRLVTLTGVAGVGKTRLAMRLASESDHEFTDGVVFVPLAPVSEPLLVASTIARGCGVRESADLSVTEVLQHALRDADLLLILDNFEQILPAAPVVVVLLNACARVKVLASSRAALRVSGECVFAVSPLALPPRNTQRDRGRRSQSAAEQLFVERALSAERAFELRIENAELVADICRRLDGLPLAIELAAAWVRVLPLDGILGRLDRPLDLLVNGPRDAEPRHRTLRAAIDWSYALLNADAQAVFRSLGVFVGGLSLDAVASVCIEQQPHEADVYVLRIVSWLVEQALVQPAELAEGEPRFLLLETVREFALERLKAAGNESEVRSRHAKYFLQLAEQLGNEERIWGQDGKASLDRLELDHDNIRAALRWAIDNGCNETALRLADAMWRLWHTRGHLAEGRRWMQEVLSLPEGQTRSSLRASLLDGEANYAYRQGDFAGVRVLDGEASAIARDVGDPSLKARALINLGLADEAQGHHAEARAQFEEARTLYRQLGNPTRQGVCLHHLALVAYHEGNYALVRAHAREAAALAEAHGSVYLLAMALRIVGFAAEEAGDFATARGVLQRALALAEEVQARWVVGETYEGLGRLDAARGDRNEARAHFADALRSHQQTGSRLAIARCLESLASLDAGAGNLESALRLIGAANTLRDSIKAPRTLRWQRLLTSWRGVAVRRLGRIRCEQTELEGRDLSLDEAIDLALSAGERADAPSGTKSETRVRSSAEALTRRETQVLRLIAAGHSNREIAAALVLSVRTVERHISSLYGKIDARGRADATAYALRIGC